MKVASKLSWLSGEEKHVAGVSGEAETLGEEMAAAKARRKLKYRSWASQA